MVAELSRAPTQPPDAQQRISQQCGVFCRYLVGVEPDQHVVAKYVDAVSRVPALATPAGGIEAVLLRVASVHPVLTRAMDAYARFFRPGALVRKRLVLLFALLESWGATTHHFDESDSGGALGFLVRMALAGLWMVLLLFLSAIVLLPLQLLLPKGAQLEAGPS